ncbi:MAG: zf-HC2 domain-containing protein [Gemmatimonadetes bacterium]|nr:zf-HC2 domain-containing protein [Gemmatimonadota bacterium]
MERPNLIERLLNLLRRWRSGEASATNGMITCREALERLFEFMDGELEGVEEKQVEEHLRICERCYPHLLFEQSFRAAVRRTFEGERAPETVRNRILELLRTGQSEA